MSKFKFLASGIIALSLLFSARAVSCAYASETLTFVHQDHLSSTTLATNEQGEVVSRQVYYPYGSTRNTQGVLPTERAYTSQVSDTDTTGLYYYNARYYNPVTALFTQADTRPDNLNKYQYVGGNPITRNDPTGHQCRTADPLAGPGEAAWCLFADPIVQLWDSFSQNIAEDRVMAEAAANNNDPVALAYYSADILTGGAVRAVGDPLYDYAEVNARANATGEDWYSRHRFEAAVKAGVPIAVAITPAVASARRSVPTTRAAVEASSASDDFVTVYKGLDADVIGKPIEPRCVRGNSIWDPIDPEDAIAHLTKGGRSLDDIAFEHANYSWAGSPATSWTTELPVAERFAGLRGEGAVVSMRIPTTSGVSISALASKRGYWPSPQSITEAERVLFGTIGPDEYSLVRYVAR